MKVRREAEKHSKRGLPKKKKTEKEKEKACELTKYLYFLVQLTREQGVALFFRNHLATRRHRGLASRGAADFVVEADS